VRRGLLRFDRISHLSCHYERADDGFLIMSWSVGRSFDSVDEGSRVE
jgi:hypothetical protein